MNLYFSVDYKEMSVRYGEVKLAVPKGFKELLEDLSREVLREQPKDIPKFAAEFFRRLLSRRGGKMTIVVIFAFKMIHHPFYFTCNTTKNPPKTFFYLVDCCKYYGQRPQSKTTFSVTYYSPL